MDIDGLPLTTALILRLIGSIGGALIALVIAAPETRKEGFQRLTVSLVAGVMLEPILSVYLGWPTTRDNIIASACIVSAIAWWLWHATVRVAEDVMFEGRLLAFLSEKFHHRGLEWYFAACSMLAGLILIGEQETFALSPYAVIREWASEEWVGIGLMCLGGARIVCLLFNGILPHGTPHLRVILSGVSALVWGDLALGYLASKTPTLMVAFLIPAVVFEVINTYRATKDAVLEDVGVRTDDARLDR